MKITYDNAVRGCFLHAVFLTISIWLWWLGAWKWFRWLPPGAEEITWFVLLAIWPAWAVVVWRVAEEKRWRIVLPVLTAFVALVPSFVPMLAVYALRHTKHI